MSSKNIKRHTFGKQKNISDLTDLLDIQLKSFNELLQIETTPDKRVNESLFKVFKNAFPVSDSKNIFVLEFLDYHIDTPRYSIAECIERGLTYSVPLKIKLRLSCNDEEHVDFQTIVQDVFLSNIPYMTPKGTFIFNGSERVVVSQLHRSPGVFFGQSVHPNGSKIYLARVIPFKGTWMEFATDINNVMYAYLDRKKNFPVTTLLRAIGYESDKDILDLFGMADSLKVNEKNLTASIGRRLASNVLRTWVEDFVDEDSGEVSVIERNEVVLERNSVLDEDGIAKILELSDTINSIHLQKENLGNSYAIIYNTLAKDPANNEEEAVQAIYRQVRGSDAPDAESARGFLDKMIFSDKRYDLGEVGRYKINAKLGLNTPMDKKVLTKEDIISIVKYLVLLSNGKAEIDDIDHLSNRRVKTVGELITAQFDIGLGRLTRTIRDRMNVRDNEVFAPVDLINSKAFNSVLLSFFGTSQLSQFLDQTNPLSELTHKRRISALGPGGLSRERAGFEVRDVHYSHYGRLCTIETPEGPNIGLISTLCVHAKINAKGFIETPYKKVTDGKVEKKPQYLSAEDEDEAIIAQSNIVVDEDGNIVDKDVKARQTGDFPIVAKKDVEFMDVAPNQIVGLSASLIPFLENDDANRALMGSNMQRQAVPLLFPENPVVGTGLESKAAKDSRIQIHAEFDGEVVYSDALEIHIRYKKNNIDRLISFDGEITVYHLTKFVKTNQSTCINLKPCVRKGDKVKKGDFLTEGYAIKNGELALGRNLKVAFMPWKGYNFEDAIVISEKVVKEDWFTSVHVDEFELEVRDTKLGEEELTNELPNIREDATKELDKYGIARVGAFVKEGDILIGKITPKGESDPSPEEKLLKAIFGEKAGDVRDASLKAPAGTEGIVINRFLFQRPKKDRAEKAKEKVELERIEKLHEANLKVLKTEVVEKLLELIGDEISSGVTNQFGEIIIGKKVKFTPKNLGVLDFVQVNSLEWTENEELNKNINILLHNYTIKHNQEVGRMKREKYSATIGDELPIGVLKLAKVFIATKRKLKVGDKMAGRHGNKGIVAKIVKEEDMPFMEDGSPVDVVLNPLGVPSRMNLGQIYETVLGWAGKELGLNFLTPIFDGATSEDIDSYIRQASLPKFGHTYLYDGETGDRFHQKVTVGIIYMLKLHHMVDDKMHARSIGPYSLITQQPLGGKAQFGGQRFGEMEVWAIEAYGAANILQELLTIKSDDMVGRNKTYDAIIKGDNPPKPGVPESFNVLIHELRGLGLDIRFE